MFPYLALLQTGFTMPYLLPDMRCALTTPFHPYPYRRYIFCGTFRRLTPPRRYLASYPIEPGLSSLIIQGDCLADSRLIVKIKIVLSSLFSHYLIIFLKFYFFCNSRPNLYILFLLSPVISAAKLAAFFKGNSRNKDSITF